VLEFIGDSALSTAIITMLMAEESRRYEHGLATELGEGDFSNIKASLSNKQNLAISTKRLGLEKYLIMGEGDERLDIGNQPSVMEDLFESIIGAIYIDSGMKIEPVIDAVGKMLDVSVYKSSAGTRTVLQSAKNALQEWCADKRHRLPAPTYATVEESGPDHEKLFVRGCYIGGILYGRGEGKNRKIADAKAAEAALERLSLEEKNADGNSTPVADLRSICATRCAAPPRYTDLGDSECSTPTDREFASKCYALGKSVIGIGKSKKEAKADAAKKLIDLL
jgi:ribonuclease-3